MDQWRLCVKYVVALIRTERAELASARHEADRYAGGLVAALKQTTIGTLEQTIAALDLEYLAAKYGLAVPPLAVPATAASPRTASDQSLIRPESPASDRPDRREGLIGVQLLGKRLSSDQTMLVFDLHFYVAALDRPARAIKGALLLKDLFGETKLSIGWTLAHPPQPGTSIRDNSSGFSFNQFMEQHQWVATTAIEDIKPALRVDSIIFKDGSKTDY